MSTDIAKESVYDSRVFQHPAKFAVEKGALSVSNAPFNAIAASTSQQSFNLYVPSENVFVDRAVEWTSTVYLTFTVANAPATAGGVSTLSWATGAPICVYGQDISLAAFPLTSLVQTMSATINDTTTIMNTQDVLKQILRLTDYKKNRTQRTCPTMLDRYVFNSDAGVASQGSVNSTQGGIQSATDYSETPNGAYLGFQWTDSAGVPLPITSSAATFTGSVNTVNNLGGVPVATSVTAATTAPIQLWCKFTSTEKIVLSPFIFSDAHEWDTGLTGINNIQLIMNMNSSPARAIRNNTTGGCVITNSSVAYNTTPSVSGVVNAIFLTPPLGLDLPAKSIVPYVEFPRYITAGTTSLAPGANTQIVSSTITLPQIPDMIIVYAKPVSYSVQEGDWTFPISSRFSTGVGNLTTGVANPLSVNFDNFSGLLSSATAEQLYAMSIKNGLDMDFNTWCGIGHSGLQTTTSSVQTATGATAAVGGGGWYATLPAGATAAGNAGFYGGTALGSGRIPLAGGMLVLKPSQDIALSTGQAPSLSGNFTLQINCSFFNPTNATQNAQMYIIAVNSGFFESIRGSSRIVKSLLSEQDIISAPTADVGDSASLARYVGGKGMFSRLSNVFRKARKVYEATKPHISAHKHHLGEKASAALGSIGYGRKGMESRLM